MKLSPQQAADYIAAYCPPEYRDPESERAHIQAAADQLPLTLDHSEVAAREAITALQQPDPASTDPTIYIPVRCPRCHHHSWHEIPPAAAHQQGINYHPARCHKCALPFLPIDHLATPNQQERPGTSTLLLVAIITLAAIGIIITTIYATLP